MILLPCGTQQQLLQGNLNHISGLNCRSCFECIEVQRYISIPFWQSRHDVESRRLRFAHLLRSWAVPRPWSRPVEFGELCCPAKRPSGIESGKISKGSATECRKTMKKNERDTNGQCGAWPRLTLLQSLSTCVPLGFRCLSFSLNLLKLRRFWFSIFSMDKTSWDVYRNEKTSKALLRWVCSGCILVASCTRCWIQKQ